jgi:murein DD-endopeptidase MepM/ murein hydrolase activator NlpD
MRSVVVFFAGFAAGIVFLAALMWRTHSPQTIRASSVPAPPAIPSVAQPSETPLPGPLPVQIPQPAQQPQAPQGDLLIPVEGVAVRDLHDNFLDMRDGHRHEALDIPAPRGTAVRAVAEGNVVKLFQSKPGGLTVYQFDDSRNWCFYYAHLDHYANGLKEGTLLRKGEVLGYVGTTGDAPPNAPHLHFAIFKLGAEKRWWEGTAVDPFPFLTGQAAWPP